MAWLLVGARGCGKTTWVAKMLIAKNEARKSRGLPPRELIYFNPSRQTLSPDLGVTQEAFTAQELYILLFNAKNCTVVIDDMQVAFPTDNKKMRELMVELLTLCRHRGMDIILVAHSFMLLPSRFASIFFNRILLFRNGDTWMRISRHWGSVVTKEELEVSHSPEMAQPGNYIAITVT